MRYHAVTLLICASLACSACTGGGDTERREYGVPEDFCGLNLDMSPFSPLYPPGEEALVDPFHSYDTGNLSPVGHCTVDVDGALAIDVRTAPSGGGTGQGVQNFLARERAEHDFREAEISEDDSGELYVWPDYAVLYTTCVESGLDNTGINFAIRLDWLDDDQDLSDELVAAIRPAMDAYLARQTPGACETG